MSDWIGDNTGDVKGVHDSLTWGWPPGEHTVQANGDGTYTHKWQATKVEVIDPVTGTREEIQPEYGVIEGEPDWVVQPFSDTLKCSCGEPDCGHMQEEQEQSND